jgi:hypothetical protein
MTSGLDNTSIYTPLDVACEELHRRRADRALEQRIYEFLEGDVPDIFREYPVAVSTAHVATPNFALIEFRNHASKADLKAVVFEYLDDLFVSTNFDKVSLAKIRFRLGTDRWHSRKIIDLGGSAEKQPLRELQTFWGEPLVEFHHRLLEQVLPDVSAHDGSSWYARRGHQPSSRYPAVMALFIRHGILFENFLTTGREREFTESVVLPAFQAVQERFGLRPLIVPIAVQNESDRMWCSYQNLLSLIPEFSAKSLA